MSLVALERRREQKRAWMARYREAHREESAAYQREYEAANIDRIAANRKKRDTSKQETLRAQKRAYTVANRAIVNGWARECYSRHRMEMQERDRRRRRKAPEQGRLQAQRYRLLNIDKVKATHRAYYFAHRKDSFKRSVQWAKLHPERVRDFAKTYRKTHPEVGRARNARRRAQKLGARDCSLTKNDVMDVLASTLGLCSYCNTRRPLTVDHIDSLASGGAHVRLNVAAVCQRCNASKGKMLFIVWMAKRQLRSAAA